ncbi:MAG: hypothetical protein COA91_06620 [Robiginitomaculum sp.]|nr:MAG: hypothetical protein COA91_06620 [Robiginitomaculum sp.]
MATIFIAGSIRIKNLDIQVKNRIDNIISSNNKIVVGDAKGADTSIQTYLHENDFSNVVVYCSGDQPRNNIGGWPVCIIHPNASAGSRAYFTAKDLKMSVDADFGLMVWDAKSTGTLSNVIELLKQDKKSVVFINKIKEFRKITTVSDLRELTKCMSEHSVTKANQKIKLFDKIEDLDPQQLSMFA